MPVKTLRIPITNVFDGNDYSAKIFIGSGKTPANVILDTGSSTLAVDPRIYDGTKDGHLRPTAHAQLVNYGTGGWAGPVIKTTLTMGVGEHCIILDQAPIAITEVQQKGNFDGVDGILGLAYSSLNYGYNMEEYFQDAKIEPAHTFPWSFPSHSFKKFSVQFGQLVKKKKIPECSIQPYFNTLETHGIVANKFAFYTLRSWVHMKNEIPEDIKKDPLNNGFFILGGGEEQKDLYTGEFVSVKVLHDLYYNTNLKTVQVAGCDIFVAQPLQEKYKSYMISNSIIDSGTSYMALSGDVYKGIMASLKKLNPNFSSLVHESLAAGISTAKLNLQKWPDIHFTLTGEDGKDVRLTCIPETYWQVNYPSPGKATFQIGGPGRGEDENQSILGLPLMNNYYSVFDRSQNSQGVVKFAKIKKP